MKQESYNKVEKWLGFEYLETKADGARTNGEHLFWVCVTFLFMFFMFPTVYWWLRWLTKER